MRKLASSLLAAAVGLCGLASTSPARAQEIQMTGPLAGAPAVRKLRKYREGRFELAPEVSFTLLDEYRRAIMPGAHAMYNITDWLAIAGYFDYGVINTTTDLTDQINGQAPRNSRTAVNVNHNADGSPASFADQTAKIMWSAAIEAQFIPFRGKLALFQKIFVDTDLYIHAGVPFVGLQERGDCGGGQKACTEPSTFALQSRMTIPYGVYGLGLKFYLGGVVSIGAEYRLLPFAWNRAGFDSQGGGNNGKFPDQKIDSNDRTFRLNQMVTLGVGFSLPASPQVSE